MSKHTPGPWVVSRGAQNHPYSIEAQPRQSPLWLCRKQPKKPRETLMSSLPHLNYLKPKRSSSGL